MRPFFVVFRLLGAAAILAAIIGQLVHSASFWDAIGIGDRKGNLVVNFFSFFTIDSNVGAVVVFLLGAVLLMRRRDDPGWFAVLRAAVTSYMAVTGIVYNMLLRGIDVGEGAVLGWSNEVLHVVGPALVIVDWLFAPGRRRLEWSRIGAIVAFPVVWAVYTMVRGPLAYNDVAGAPTWYPYPFLNPANSPEGYVSVAFYVILIAAIIGGVGAAVIWVSRRRPRWPAR
ncbi:MAG TPA: Pr6Pr family membrane protein [Pseudolysinimonas sp.]|nr:Pr6Pr family membrane protein [Pseudolysinimonas sp.]